MTNNHFRAWVAGALFLAGAVVAACSSESDDKGAAGAGGTVQATGGAAGAGGTILGDGGSPGVGGSAGTGGTNQGTGGSIPGTGGSTGVTGPELDELVAGNNQFAFDLYHKVATSETNHLSSPLSLSVALGMTWAGARTTTESEMAAALHFTLPQDKLHRAMKELLGKLASREVVPDKADDPSLQLDLVNAVWVQKGFSLLQPYVDTVTGNYGTGISLIDFGADPQAATDTINAWVAGKTSDKIQGLIPPGSIDGFTRLVLTNALYFLGSWNDPFDATYTHDNPFHAAAGDVTASTMSNVVDSRYAEGDGWKMADLAYTGGQVAMTIVLPDAGRFDEVRGAMSSSWLAAADNKFAQESVDFRLPKFRFTWGTESMVEPLKALGMQKPFTQDADFSGMADLTGQPPLNIGNVFHKAFISIDEKGTEAAAASAVVVVQMDAGGMPPPPKQMIVDRPFLFMIRDRSTHSVLFVGHVADPTKE